MTASQFSSWSCLLLQCFIMSGDLDLEMSGFLVDSGIVHRGDCSSKGLYSAALSRSRNCGELIGIKTDLFSESHLFRDGDQVPNFEGFPDSEVDHEASGSARMNSPPESEL